jgi:hypothetical protein
LLEIKNMLIHSLKEWSAAASLVPHSSTINFLDSCNPKFFFVFFELSCTRPVYQNSFFDFNKTFITDQKKIFV